MNILFLSISTLPHLSEHSLYADLLRQLHADGHQVYAVSPRERRFHLETEFCHENGITVLRLKTGNITKTNVIEKGITTLLIDRLFQTAIKKYFSDVRFDLILYATPPITYVQTIKYLKKRDGAKTFLLLKDIFPQNAVDLGMLSRTGVKGFLYRHFRNTETQLYRLSDFIGCMSQANVNYIRKHHPTLPADKIMVCPNSVEPQALKLTDVEKRVLREKYQIPQDKTVFVYGGNLGKPQGIDFLISGLQSQADHAEAFFLIVGAGTEYSKLEQYLEQSGQKNVRLMQKLPREEYDRMIASCDVGLIFLDHRFTIPNFPSRLLAYQQAGLPVLACTDRNTDVGSVLTEGGFGWWCESTGAHFDGLCREICALAPDERAEMGRRGNCYLLEHFTAKHSCQIIEKAALRPTLILKKTGNHTLLYTGEQESLSYKKGVLYAHKQPEDQPNPIASLPASVVRRFLCKIRLTERLLRLEPRCAFHLAEKTFLVSWSGGIWRVDVTNGTITKEHSYRNGMNNPLDFADLTGLSQIDYTLVYGEYFSNPDKKAVSVFARKENRWEEIYTFAAGTIQHIHRILPDPVQDRILILTGDDDDSSGIWETRDGFQTVQPLLVGNQRYRACVAFPNETGIVYATDTPLQENAIYQLRESEDGISSHKLFSMPGPCIFGMQQQSPGGWDNYIMATSVEPDSRLSGWRYKLTYCLGDGVRDRECHIIMGNEKKGFSEQLSLRKDFLPMTLFQFGNVKFPRQEHKTTIYAVPQSIKGYDASTVSITVDTV